MIEITIQVSAEDFARLEEAVFEVEEATHWNLFEDFESKGYRVQGIFENEEVARTAWKSLSEIAEVKSEAKMRELKDSDWKDSYKEHFKPWNIGPLHWVPMWLRNEYEMPEGHEAVWLDPGMAFGTGNHETTRLCVEQLIATRERLGECAAAARVVDAGCGSGILAISAKRLGFDAVSAFDNDPDAVRIAVENAEINGVPDVPFATADLVSGFSDSPYEVVIANILAVTLVQFRDQVSAAVASGGTLVLSGILDKEIAGVEDAYKLTREWDSIERSQMGEWTSLTLVAK